MTDTQEKLFTDWLEKHKNLIFKVVRAYATVFEDQNDLFQDILLQLWSSIPNFNSNCKETTWIYRVALNTAIVWHRGKTRKKRRHPAMLESVEKSSDQSAGDSQTQNEQVLKQLYDAIRQLPKAESPIVLLYLDGLSYDEMADVLGITINNVGVRLNRAKKNLAQSLKGVIDEF